MHLKRGPGVTDTPPCALHHRQDVVTIFAPRAMGRLSVIGELTSGGLIRYQENQRRGTPLPTPGESALTGSWDKCM